MAGKSGKIGLDFVLDRKPICCVYRVAKLLSRNEFDYAHVIHKLYAKYSVVT